MNNKQYAQKELDELNSLLNTDFYLHSVKDDVKCIKSDHSMRLFIKSKNYDHLGDSISDIIYMVKKNKEID